jgi:hypothetical protein
MSLQRVLRHCEERSDAAIQGPARSASKRVHLDRFVAALVAMTPPIEFETRTEP